MFSSRRVIAILLGAGVVGLLTPMLIAGNAQAANLTWVGDDFANDWDTTSSNWTGDATVYTDGDHVTFDDTGSTSSDVNLTTNLLPGSVTVNNSSLFPYGFSGAGTLDGTTGITKSGDGTLTVNTANTFDGVVNVNGGTFAVGNPTALGSPVGGTTVNGGTLELNGQDLKDPGDSSKIEKVTAQGAGVDGLGAIVNNTEAASRIHHLVLSGDATFGGSERLGIWGPLDPAYPGVTPDFGDYTITIKHFGGIAGHDQVRIVNTYGHTLKDANVVQGTLAFHNAHFGNADGTFTVSSDGGIKLFDSKSPYDDVNNDLNKNLDFTGGQVYVYRGKFSINATSGTVTLNDTVTTFNVYSYSSTYLTQLWIDGLVTGDGGINKIGNGLLRLTAANDYTGATTVADGTLRIDGSITSDTTVMGESSAHLDGSGSILGNVTIEPGNYIEPGTSIGTLTVTGDVTMAGSFVVEYDGGTETIDLLDISGVLDIDAATLDLTDLTAGAETLDDPFYVFASYGTLGGTTKVFATVNGLPDGYSLDYDYLSNNDIALVEDSPPIPGDATGDDEVDADDAQRLAENWGEGTPETPATWSQGNFDGDDVVGPKDAAIMAANWGYGVTEASAVPEPSVAVMLLATLGAWLVWRRR